MFVRGSPPDEVSRDQPDLDPRRWNGREGVDYLLDGKNGLPRIARISHELDRRIDETRLPVPIVVNDRGNEITCYYDIPGGQRLSQSITSASNAAFGRGNSDGAHGFRHQFVAERLEHYRLAGFSWTDACLLTSQEIGHWRPESILAYIRQTA